MITEISLLVLEIVGTIAFSVSGALVSIKAKLDMFGVILLGLITSVGGGIIRDILMGNHPPRIFGRYELLIISVLVSIVVFEVSYINRHKFSEFKKKIEHINNVFDAIGLGAFTVMGTEVAFENGHGKNFLLAVALGVITAVGGGVIRDLLVNHTPYILIKHVYALVSIVGAILFYILRLNNVNAIVSMAVPVILIVFLRILAAKYRWELPKIRIDDEDNTPAK